LILPEDTREPKITQIFCDVDDFCMKFEPEWEQILLQQGEKKRRRSVCLSTSEIITLLIIAQQSGYRNFKWFYQKKAIPDLKKEFPALPSYNRFIELIPRVLVPITCFMKSRCRLGKGISFVDSTPLRVCKNIRIPRHKTFNGIAQRGKSSTGWFYGFKLHLIVDDCGNIVSFSITKGNVDDRKPLPTLARNLVGKLFADRGYISKKLTALLAEKNLKLITTVRKNMKPRVLEAFDKAMLRQRSIIETINDQLKNIFQVEHSRHRSLTNYLVEVVAGLVAYSYQDKLPSLNLRDDLISMMAA